MSEPKDLIEELADRAESTQWDLRDCPCCGARPRLLVYEGDVTIICSQWGCRHVKGANLEGAAYVWNSPRFTDK
jgi:hypothetical protein